MASSRGENTFRDITNISITDAKELKRQRARERYANMPADKKSALLKRRRESYHSNKNTSALGSDDGGQTPPDAGELDVIPTEQGSYCVVEPCSSGCNKENMPPQTPQNHNMTAASKGTDSVVRSPDFRQKLIKGASGVGYVKSFLRKRWEFLATVV